MIYGIITLAVAVVIIAITFSEAMGYDSILEVKNYEDE